MKCKLLSSDHVNLAVMLPFCILMLLFDWWLIIHTVANQKYSECKYAFTTAVTYIANLLNQNK